MKSTAEKLERKIKTIGGIADTQSASIVFLDTSEFRFELTKDQKARTIGDKHSVSYEFASNIQSLETTADGFKIVFKDGSQFEYNLGAAIQQHPPSQ